MMFVIPKGIRTSITYPAIRNVKHCLDVDGHRNVSGDVIALIMWADSSAASVALGLPTSVVPSKSVQTLPPD
jgi:hypothetical protein